MRHKRHIVGVILPLAAIVTFTALLVYSFAQLNAVQRDMRIGATQNMLWVLSRAQTATLHLDATTARHALTGADGAEVSRRLDIWFGAMGVLRDGPQQRQMAAIGFAADLERISAAGPALEAAALALLAGERQAAARIHAILSPLEAGLAGAANQAMIAQWDELGAQLDRARGEMRQIGVSLAAIALAGLVLVIHLMAMTRASTRHARLLKQERAFSELLVSSSGIGIVAMDRQGRCTSWNGAMSALFGLCPEQALGRSLADLAGFFEAGGIGEARRAALCGEHRTIPDRPLRPDGSSHPTWVDTEIFPLHDHGAITGAMLLVSDVTGRNEAQRTLARHRDQLEAEVARRTGELDAALKRERAALDIYRNFAAMISHQFRTPLAIVDSSLQRIMRRGDRLTREELAERGRKARAAIARLVQLVESILDAAQLDSGQIEVRRKPCDLAAIARASIRQVAELGDRATLKVGDGGPVIALGDPVQIEHILINLLSNAAKYAPEGSPVRIEVEGDVHRTRCRIVNMGTIEAGERRHLFDRYFRGANSREVSGIGIGLYMARNLARLQGGDMWLEDGEADRVGFVLMLPRAVQAAGPVEDMA